ncbi:MAG: GNAT family protein [Pseudomonadota bacterium]
MTGRYVALEPADPEAHAADLFAAYRDDREGRGWTYMPYGPFDEESAFAAWMAETCLGPDPMFFAARVDGQAVGLASYLRIAPQPATIEVGHIHLAPALKGTRAATEAMALMMDRAFGLGYRRYEWKCDALNAASRAAALRLGFAFEGIHRQVTHYKGRNRDTAWFSILDGEWPGVKAGFDAWLDDGNFDASGRQTRSLAACREAARG